MAAYQLIRHGLTGATIGVLRRADGAQIPADEENADYRDFLEWVRAANAPDEPAAVTDEEQLTRLGLVKLVRLLIKERVITAAQVKAALLE